MPVIAWQFGYSALQIYTPTAKSKHGLKMKEGQGSDQA
jgi:hypothetical protein